MGRPFLVHTRSIHDAYNRDFVQIKALNQREVKKPTWGAQGGPPETDKEWIARGGHLTTKKAWDAIDFGVKGKLHDWLAPHQAHCPEFDLWEAFFTLTVEDAIGLSPTANHPCEECHREAEDGCNFGPGHRKDTKHNSTCTWTPHTVQQCALDYLNGPMAEEDCELLGIAVDYLRQLLAELKTKPKRQIIKQPVKI